MKNWSKILLKPSDSLENAIKVLHVGGLQIVLVVDNNGKLLGTITDGDIRRALIRKVKMKGKIKEIMNHHPVTAKSPYSRDEILMEMSNRDLLHMPIVNNDGVVCGLETLKHLIERPNYDNPVFLMAGGFGTRLHPLTEDIPKPLLRVGKEPLLETIIKQFINVGFHNFATGTEIHEDIVRVKRWLEEQQLTNYAVEASGITSKRVYYVPDEESANTLVAQMLPLSGFNPGSLQGLKLVANYGSYWVYEILPGDA